LAIMTASMMGKRKWMSLDNSVTITARAIVSRDTPAKKDAAPISANTPGSSQLAVTFK
jgi:hypothetical protein